MRISDEQYFRSCVAKERHLAQLLGHQHIEECYESAGTLWDNAQALPKWTRDWRACGPLLTQYRIALAYEQEMQGEGAPDGVVIAGATTVTLSDHPNRDRAVMYAIVKEVIRILEHHHVAKSEEAAPLHPHP
ncbi:aminoacyl-tRNA synthetase [Polaromonas sp.]|uniref:aminoacyl-tRNA synthetase n=1 Tax=Polaromonas sp. TaxID=1869339 RepID=UPI002FC76AA5